MKVFIPTTRLAFPALFEAQAIEGDKPKFGGKFIIDPHAAIVATLDQAIEQVAREKWGVKAPNILAGFVRTGRKPDVFFVREAYKTRDGDPYDGFDGMFYASASNDVRPTIVDRDKTPLQPQDGKPYAGCYVNAILEVWAQDNKYGRAIRATLKGVQFVRDGDAFAGGTAANPDDFDDLTAGADAEFA